MPSVASAYPFFDVAEKLELACAEIYQALAELFEAQPAARELFRKLADEERQHASRVRLLAARYRHDARLFGGVETFADRLAPLLAEALAVRDRIRAGAWVADLEIVRGELVDLEDRFQAAHAQVIAGLGDPGLRRFFEQMAAQDDAHRELLRG
jgi:rubrerythrin